MTKLKLHEVQLYAKTITEWLRDHIDDPGDATLVAYYIKRDIADAYDEYPVITPEMVEETNIEIARRRAGRYGSSLKNIVDATCSICGSQSVSFTDNLVLDMDIDGERVMVQNLTGIRCSNCGDIYFDADAIKIIEGFKYD